MFPDFSGALAMKAGEAFGQYIGAVPKTRQFCTWKCSRQIKFIFWLLLKYLSNEEVPLIVLIKCAKRSRALGSCFDIPGVHTTSPPCKYSNFC